MSALDEIREAAAVLREAERELAEARVERDAAIVHLVASGVRQADLARLFGLTRARVCQICKRAE